MKKKLLSFLSLTAIAIFAFAATQSLRRATGTEIWSSETPVALVWDKADITIPAEKFASAKVGDIIHVNMTDVTTGATNPWDAQVSFRSTNWKNLEANQNIAGVGSAEPITDAQYVLTGDMVKILKATGAQINGTGAKVSSVTLESVAAATGSDKSIWVGTVTKNNVTINNCHFANFDNFNGVKKGDIIRVYLEKTDEAEDNWIGLTYNKGWTWTDFAEGDIEKVSKDETGLLVDFIIKSDAAVKEINDADNNNGVFVVCPKQTVKQVELTREYAVTVADDIKNGTVNVDKTVAAEGDVVTVTATPAAGYKLFNALARGVTTDVAIEVKNGKFTMPADAVTVSATFAQPEDITISPESGADIYTALKAATTDAGKIAKNITINLAADGAYTISKSIEAGAGVKIVGAAGAKIDASALTTPFILMSKTPAVAGTTVGTNEVYNVAEVSVKDVEITGLPYQLFFANGVRYLVGKLSVDNSVIGINGTNKKTIFDFAGRGCAEEISVNNSTIWANPSNAQNGGLYSSQSGDWAGDLGGTKQILSITNSTIYNIAYGKTICTQRQNSKAGMGFVVKNSIIANCGKSGQFIVGLDGGGYKTVPTWEIDTNSINYDGADVNAAESAKIVEGGGTADVFKNGVPGVVAFTDAANGNFKLANCAQNTAHIGDPRWLDATVEPAAEDIVISPETGVDLYTALFNATIGANKKAKDITINLAANGAYTISNSIEAGANVKIVGAAGAKIDASALKTPFILMSKTPAVAGTTVGSNEVYNVSEVSIKDVEITGLPYQLFYANGMRYLIGKLIVENSVIGINGTNKKTIFDFAGRGNAEELSVNKSTLWANPALAQAGGLFSCQSGDWAGDLGGTKQILSITNSTLYNISYGKNTCAQRQNSKAGMGFVVKNSIIANCGKSGQFIVGLDGGGYKTVPTWEIDTNSINYDGADVNAAESAKIVEGGGTADVFKNGVPGVVAFADAANGDFTIGATTAQAKFKIGDPRWLVAFTGYTITMGTVTNGTVEAGGTSPYFAGEKVRLTLTPAEGYAIDNKPTFKNDEDVDVTELVTVGQDADGFYLVMPAFNITASYAFSKLYTITLPTETTHGTITIVKPEGTNKSVAGKLIKIKVTGLSDGYKVVAKNGDTDITLNEGDHATYDYYFEMPEGDVTISIVDATGINAISVDGAADIFADGKPVYNLAGQRVFKGYKGLVIKNGKKVVVK